MPPGQPQPFGDELAGPGAPPAAGAAPMAGGANPALDSAEPVLAEAQQSSGGVPVEPGPGAQMSAEQAPAAPAKKPEKKEKKDGAEAKHTFNINVGTKK